MPEDERDQLAEILALRETATSLLAKGAANAATHEEARAKRLDAMLKGLGPRHPRSARLAQRSARAAARAKALAVEVKRLPRRPADRDAWSIVGHVRNPDGKPGKNLNVKVVARNARLNEVLKGGKTDANGDFMLAYTAADLGNLHREARNLSLTVKKGNKVLYTSPATLAFASMSTEYFDLTLEA